MSNTQKATGVPTPPQADLDVLLAGDERPEDTVPICLRGDLLAKWKRLKAQYDAGPGDEDKAMLVDRAAKRRVAEQMAQVEAEMRAGTVEFRLRALPRRRTPGMPKDLPTWHELVEAHPPRKDDKGKPHPHDASLGVNRATFLDALVRVSIVEPDLTDERWDRLNAKLNDAQFERLFLAAWSLNRAEVDVPFSRAASMMRKLDAGSRRPSDSASPSVDSTDGNPPPSPPTSTTSAEG